MSFRDWLRQCSRERDPKFEQGFDYALFLSAALAVAVCFVLSVIGAVLTAPGM